MSDLRLGIDDVDEAVVVIDGDFGVCDVDRQRAIAAFVVLEPIVILTQQIPGELFDEFGKRVVGLLLVALADRYGIGLRDRQPDCRIDGGVPLIWPLSPSPSYSTSTATMPTDFSASTRTGFATASACGFRPSSLYNSARTCS